MKKRVICVSGILIFVCAVLVMPGEILIWQSGRELDVVEMVPEDRYRSGNSAFAGEAPDKLSNEEKMQLIRGSWDSEISEAGEQEMKLQEYEAVKLAREKLTELYNKGEFPADLEQVYQNWHGWQAKSYKAVDTTFHTHTAYFWEILFERFDQAETYTVRMLEDGTIFEK